LDRLKAVLHPEPAWHRNRSETVSGKELETDRDEAIRRGEQVRDQAVDRYRASLPTQHPAMLLYDLTGRETVVTQKGR